MSRWPGGVGAVHSIGAVRTMRTGHAGGHFRDTSGFAMDGRAAKFSRVVTSGAKRGGTGGDALRRAMHVGGSRDVGGPRPLMVSCGGVAIPGRQRLGEISGLDVVDGSVRIYVRSMWLASPAGGCPGQRRWLGFGRRRRLAWGWLVSVLCWGAQVVTFDMSGSGAVNGVGVPRCGRALMLRAASSSVASSRSARTRPVPQGSGMPMEWVS